MCRTGGDSSPPVRLHPGMRLRRDRRPQLHRLFSLDRPFLFAVPSFLLTSLPLWSCFAVVPSGPVHIPRCLSGHPFRSLRPACSLVPLSPISAFSRPASTRSGRALRSCRFDPFRSAGQRPFPLLRSDRSISSLPGLPLFSSFKERRRNRTAFYAKMCIFASYTAALCSKNWSNRLPCTGSAPS